MNFNNEKAIYLQMADRLCDEIVAGQYHDDERIPSVREYAVLLQVNTNTAMKAYDQLARDEIIYNKRGIGYFVSAEARGKILEAQKAEFLEKEVPAILRKMELLGLDGSIFKK